VLQNPQGSVLPNRRFDLGNELIELGATDAAVDGKFYDVRVGNFSKSIIVYSL
jgi:hypothetical protein